MAEDDLLQFRRDKLAALEEAGVEPFPARATVDSTVQAARAQWDDSSAEELEESQPVVRLAGRMVALREHGKSAFSDLDDGTATLQCHLRQKQLGEDSFAAWLDLDLGDFVSVEGPLFRTRTGELTVRVDAWQFVAKSLRPMPEKWHGLKDTEVRYRQRYLDLLANPEVRDLFRRRAEIVRALRAHLDSNDFLEVETPTLQPLYGGAAARPFRTHHNTLDIDLYLRIAPELYLKRLLVGGLQRVYDLNRNFRNEGISRQHNPEFTMLEFYEAYADFEDLIRLTETMLRELAVAVTGDSVITYQGERYDFGRPFQRLSVSEAILAHNPGVDAAALETDAGAREVAASLGIPLKPEYGRGKVLIEIFEKTAEPNLAGPVFITHYPAEVSPLARRSDDDAFVTDRFEFFVAGREIANGFSELNDPDDQAERFRAQVEAKAGGDDEAMHFDDDYITALEHGMPPTAGEGIGIDRLVMLLTDSASIRDVLLFPHMRPQRDGAD